MANIVGVEGAPDNKDQTPAGIHLEEEGNGSVVGYPATIIRGLCERDGVRGQVEGARSVVASYKRGKAAEKPR